MLKKVLIKILFRLLGQSIKYDGVEDKKITHWLETQYADMGFRDYFKRRDLRLLKIMGIGLTRENYLITLGQRLELMALLQAVDKTYKAREKKVEKKRILSKKAEK